MFGLGFMEIIMIAAVALLFVGPQKLPDTLKQVGKFFIKFREVTSEARQAVDDVMSQAQRELAIEETKKLKETIEVEVNQALESDDSVDSTSQDETS